MAVASGRAAARERLVAEETVCGLRWQGPRRVGIVTWVEPAEGGFGLKTFAGLDRSGSATAAKYFAVTDALSEARSGDIVTFEEGDISASGISRIGRADEQAAFVANLIDRAGGHVSIQVGADLPPTSVACDAALLGEARMGDFLTFTVTDGMLRTASVVCSALRTTPGQCLVCFDERPLAGTCSNADHRFCLECVQRHVLAKMGDLREYPIKCLASQEGCSALDLHGVVKAVLTDRDLETLERRDVAAALGPNFAAICSICGHVSYASTTRSNGSGQCERCRGVFCRNCGACDGSHLRLSCADYRAQQDAVQAGEDAATRQMIEATTKPCPSCGFRTTHFHGHACHHITPNGGCPNCHEHWCYACAQPINPANPHCQVHGSTFCKNDGIADHLVQEPYPHDSRCGCPICNICRPGAPCEQCEGDCVVCQGQVPPGPSQAR